MARMSKADKEFLDEFNRLLLGEIRKKNTAKRKTKTAKKAAKKPREAEPSDEELQREFDALLLEEIKKKKKKKRKSGTVVNATSKKREKEIEEALKPKKKKEWLQDMLDAIGDEAIDEEDDY